jgi:hypothetical protein
MDPKKTTDEKKVGNIFAAPGNAPIVGGNIAAGNIQARRLTGKVTLFIRALNALLERQREKRGRLIQLFYDLFGSRLEKRKSLGAEFIQISAIVDAAGKISSQSELRKLMRLLTFDNFYATADTEKQEKYIGALLEYLVRERPQDYEFILEQCFPDDILIGKRYPTDVIASVIVRRLAGDSSTDAPPPPPKKS